MWRNFPLHPIDLILMQTYGTGNFMLSTTLNPLYIPLEAQSASAVSKKDLRASWNLIDCRLLPDHAWRINIKHLICLHSYDDGCIICVLLQGGYGAYMCTIQQQACSGQRVFCGIYGGLRTVSKLQMQRRHASSNSANRTYDHTSASVDVNHCALWISLVGKAAAHIIESHSKCYDLSIRRHYPNLCEIHLSDADAAVLISEIGQPS